MQVQDSYHGVQKQKKKNETKSRSKVHWLIRCVLKMWYKPSQLFFLQLESLFPIESSKDKNITTQNVVILVGWMVENVWNSRALAFLTNLDDVNCHIT
jgi:hypothetical protein